jgi:hypothetical protein
LKLDASKDGFGVFVFQLAIPWIGGRIPVEHIKPIIYLSKTMIKEEAKYWPTESEVIYLV